MPASSNGITGLAADDRPTSARQLKLSLKAKSSLDAKAAAEERRQMRLDEADDGKDPVFAAPQKQPVPRQRSARVVSALMAATPPSLLAAYSAP